MQSPKRAPVLSFKGRREAKRSSKNRHFYDLGSRVAIHGGSSLLSPTTFKIPPFRAAFFLRTRKCKEDKYDGICFSR